MKLTEYLTVSGLTQGKFAEMVGVSQAALGRYAAGKRLPRPAILRRIVAASGGAVQANDFFAGEAADAASPPGSAPALDAEVTAIDMLICDMCGMARGKRLDRAGLATLYDEGIAMPGSTYALDITGGNVDGLDIGMADGDPDSLCRPVADTLAPVPWAGPGRAQVLTGMHDDAGRPLFLDPRQVLARVVERFRELGLRPVMAIELEFYLLDAERDEQDRPRPAASPFSGRRPQDAQVYSMDDLDDTAGVIDAMVAAARSNRFPRPRLPPSSRRVSLRSTAPTRTTRWPPPIMASCSSARSRASPAPPASRPASWPSPSPSNRATACMSMSA